MSWIGTTSIEDCLTTNIQTLSKPLDNRVDIHAGFIFAGRSLSSPPEAVEFGIKVGNVGGPKFKNGDAPELTAVVDGETISLGNVTVVKSRTSVVTTESTRQVSFGTVIPGLSVARKQDAVLFLTGEESQSVSSATGIYGFMDDSRAKSYVRALKTLEKKGLMELQSKSGYYLTNVGWKAVAAERKDEFN